MGADGGGDGANPGRSRTRRVGCLGIGKRERRQFFTTHIHRSRGNLGGIVLPVRETPGLHFGYRGEIQLFGVSRAASDDRSEPIQNRPFDEAWLIIQVQPKNHPKSKLGFRSIQLVLAVLRGNSFEGALQDDGRQRKPLLVPRYSRAWVDRCMLLNRGIL